MSTAIPPTVSTRDLVIHRMIKLGIPSAIKGGLLAVGVKAYSDIRSAKEERDAKKVVKGPSIDARVRGDDGQRKEAFSEPGNWMKTWPRGSALTDLPVTALAAIVPGYATYEILSRHFDNREKQQLEREIARVKSRHLDKVTGTVGKDSKEDPGEVAEAADEISKAVSDLPNIVKGSFSTTSTKERKSAEWKPPAWDTIGRTGDLLVGGLVVTTVAAGLMAHRGRLRRERDLDALYRAENKKKFRESNPDLFAPSVARSIGTPYGRKSAATALQNTLIALNLHGLYSGASAKEERQTAERAAVNSVFEKELLDEDLADILAVDGRGEHQEEYQEEERES